ERDFYGARSLDIGDSPRGTDNAFWFHPCGIAQIAHSKNPSRHTEISRRAALQPEVQRALTEKSSARSYGVMSRGRNFRRRRPPRFGLSAVDLRFGSGTRHRPCHRDFQSARALGRGGEIEFYRLPLSRAGLSQPARAGHELFQHLLQPARRTHPAPVLPPGEPKSV